MTIRRGVEWGSVGPMPTDASIASTDAQLARLIADAVLSGQRALAIGLVGGDLCRTVGGLGQRARLHTNEARRLPVDALVVTLDERAPMVAVAHVIVGSPWRVMPWHRGPLLAAMNAQFVGRFDVAPRSHPNDGRFDLVDASALGARDRVKAWRRLPTGAHVPHPSISEQRLTETSLRYEHPVRVRVDGVDAGRAVAIEIRIVPDALIIVV